MNLIQLFRNIKPFVKPYRWLVIITLILTLIGSLIAQVNAVVLDRTVVIISHSISQIIDSDIIYALKNGRVEQSGNPDEVYRQGGIYKDIVDASARSLNIDKLASQIRCDLELQPGLTGDGFYLRASRGHISADP